MMPMYEPSIMAAGLLDLAKKSMVRRHPVSLPPRWGNERPVQGRTTVNATHSFRSTVPGQQFLMQSIVFLMQRMLQEILVL